MNDFDHQILSRHTYGLVDAVMAEDLPNGIATETVSPPDLAAHAHLMPKLIDLRNLPPDISKPLLECLYRAHQEHQQPPMPLLVQTKMAPHLFLRQWNALQVSAPQPGHKVWLRLHDPRVLHQLLRMATPAQRRHLFGKCESYTYWVGEEWLTVHIDDGPHNGNQIQQASGMYSAMQRLDWTRIGRIGIINRALAQANVLSATALMHQGALAEQLIERAQTRHGIVDRGDLVEFVVRGVTTSSEFDEHPELACLLKPRTDPDDESSLADRLAGIEDRVWNDLRQSVKTELGSDK